jgi:hypothetical protein
MIVAPLKESTDLLLHVGTLVGFFWVLVWALSALFVGRTWQRMTLEKEQAARDDENPTKLTAQSEEIENV